MTNHKKVFHPPGTPPGTLTKVQSMATAELRIRLIDYDAKDVAIREDVAASDCGPYVDRDSVTWVHVQGTPSEAALRKLGKDFGLHLLALEDVLNTGQRPKIQSFDDQLFIVMSLPTTSAGIVEIYQVSLFLSSNFVVSFCEFDFALFQPIIDRLQNCQSRLRSRGADFLLYSLVDVVIDRSFPVLDSFGVRLEDLEDQLLKMADANTLRKIQIVRRDLLLLRRMLWPQREVINNLLRDDYVLVREPTLIYLRDCYDHAVHVMDLLETYREMTGGMLDIYLSGVSNRTNEVMRVLTIIATIFIPLTFIVGVYGMNFDRNASAWNMPELGSPYGYVVVWGAMIGIAVIMVAFFRRRGWF